MYKGDGQPCYGLMYGLWRKISIFKMAAASEHEKITGMLDGTTMLYNVHFLCLCFTYAGPPRFSLSPLFLESHLLRAIKMKTLTAKIVGWRKFRIPVNKN